MDDTGFVARFERLRDLPSDCDEFLERDGTFGDPLRERRSLDHLQNERFHAVRFFQPVDARDIRMVQRSEELRFPFEPRQALFVFREFLGKDFDRYVAVELGVASPVDLTSSR